MSASSGPAVTFPGGISPPSAWLSVSKSSSPATTNALVSADPTGLPAGTYEGYVSITASPNNVEWVYVLFVVTQAAGGQAQTTSLMNCYGIGAVGGIPTLIRTGVTELAGDIVLSCTGGIPTINGSPIPTSNIRIFFSTETTGRITNSDFSEALLAIDDPAAGSQIACSIGPCAGTGANIFQARQTGPSTLTWFNVPIDPPGTNT